MSVFQENEQRQVFLQVVKENILGPGACKSIFLCSNDLSDEIINKHPVDQYYSGILFPKSKMAPLRDLPSEDEEEPISEEASTENQGDSYGENEDAEDNPVMDLCQASWQKKYYPSHIGLIFCVSDNARIINITFSYAKYFPMQSREDVKVKFGEIDKQYKNNKQNLELFIKALEMHNCYSIFEDGNNFTLDTAICWHNEERAISLAEVPIITEKGVRRPFERKDLTKLFNKLKEIQNDISYGHVMKKLSFLLDKRLYRRKEKTVAIILDNLADVLETRHSIEGNDDIIYSYKIFSVIRNGRTRKFIKVLLENKSHWETGEGETANSRGWRNRSLFQAEIKVESDNIIDYRDPIPNIIDEENSITEYVYREEKSFAKGIGCAVQWEEAEQTKWIRTSYMPEVYARDFSNKPHTELAENDQVFKLKNLSAWSEWDDHKIIEELSAFINKFNNWCANQAALANQETGGDNLYERILAEQEILKNRLIENIDYLNNNPIAFKCFKIANSAMFVQMVIARHPIFRKNRDLAEIQNHHFRDLDYFKKLGFPADISGLEPKYRPFQLAFLLMNVRSTFEQEDQFRDKVDLIWFPTGGGKTEAYLALTALTIIARRRCNQLPSGVSVIMRYTLRLLTTQQFERATYLICALEFLRANEPDFCLYDAPITIGMWVGGGTTPNRSEDLNPGRRNKFSQFITDAGGANIDELSRLQNRNPFPIAYCPWCGCKLLTCSQEGALLGYFRNGDLKCQNEQCHFGSEGKALPIYYIDDKIYQIQPTLLFGTVDKFANLNNQHGSKLFNSGPYNQGLPPDLIIQDELHLISGPLGSMVGLFESIIELMASKSGRKPKIIASTATTRNTRFLVKQLYCRDVCIFPAQGIRYSDNFFSRAELNSNKRLHTGILPTGRTAAMTEIKLVSLLIIAKIQLFTQYLKSKTKEKQLVPPHEIISILTGGGKLNTELDDFWTPVLFYNSLRDLGRTKSRIFQEIYETIRSLSNYAEYPEILNFIIENFYSRVYEFTSRENSSKIKSLLTKAESAPNLTASDNKIYVQDGMDLIMASNMISVGIDIPRLNVMVFAGQPRSVSEYIQSSSRIARERKGIVFNLLNAARTREMSLFENFTSFHKVYYKYVEPLSATPFTEPALDKLLNNILVCYVRHILGVQANEIQKADISPLIAFLKERCTDGRQQKYIKDKLNSLLSKWINLAEEGKIVDYNYFVNNNDEEFQLMKSLRSVGPDCFAKIRSLNYN